VQTGAQPLQIVDSSTPRIDFPQPGHTACFTPLFLCSGPLIRSGNDSEKADEIQIGYVADINHGKAVQKLSKNRSKLEKFASELCE
jgi:hypothetical protein